MYTMVKNDYFTIKCQPMILMSLLFYYLHSSFCLWSNLLIHFDEAAAVVNEYSIMGPVLQIYTKDKVQKFGILQGSIINKTLHTHCTWPCKTDKLRCNSCPHYKLSSYLWHIYRQSVGTPCVLTIFHLLALSLCYLLFKECISFHFCCMLLCFS